MPVPTGTWSPWRQLGDDAAYDEVVYIRDGHDPGPSDLLAEALRMDGVVPTLGLAIRAAEQVTPQTGYYGHVDDDSEEVLCDSDGETSDGEYVDEILACVVARIRVGG